MIAATLTYIDAELQIWQRNSEKFKWFFYGPQCSFLVWMLFDNIQVQAVQSYLFCSVVNINFVLFALFLNLFNH